MPSQHGDQPDPACRVLAARTSTMLPPWANVALLGVLFAACAWIAHLCDEHQVLNGWASLFVSFGGMGVAGLLLVCSLVKQSQLLYSPKDRAITATLRKPVWSTPTRISLPLSTLDRIEAVPAAASLVTRYGLWRRERNRWTILSSTGGDDFLLVSDLDDEVACRAAAFILAEVAGQLGSMPEDAELLIQATDQASYTRIELICRDYLTEIKHCDDIVKTLYQDPRGNLWVKEWPNFEFHGGGRPVLKRVSDREATAIFGPTDPGTASRG